MQLQSNQVRKRLEGWRGELIRREQRDYAEMKMGGEENDNSYETWLHISSEKLITIIFYTDEQQLNILYWNTSADETGGKPDTIRKPFCITLVKDRDKREVSFHLNSKTPQKSIRQSDEQLHTRSSFDLSCAIFIGEALCFKPKANIHTCVAFMCSWNFASSPTFTKLVSVQPIDKLLGWLFYWEI